MRENVKIRKMQISFILYIYWLSYATFSLRRFLWTSVFEYKDALRLRVLPRLYLPGSPVEELWKIMKKMIVCPSSLHSCVLGTNFSPIRTPGEIMSFSMSPKLIRFMHNGHVLSFLCPLVSGSGLLGK